MTDLAIPCPTQEAVVVRDAAPEDHEAICWVLRAAYGQYAPALHPVLYERYLADLLDLDRHEGHGRLLVAESAGQVVGFVAFYPDISVQGVGWPAGWAGGRALAVDPTARGLGVAHTLVATCESLARDSNAPTFAFHTALFMNAAIALYGGLGFERAPQFDLDLRDVYAVPDAPASPIVAFRRDLISDTRHAQPSTEGNDMTTELLAEASRAEANTHVEYVCPACGGAAEVEWRDWADSTDGAVEHVKIRCTDRHWFLMPAERLNTRSGRELYRSESEDLGRPRD